MSDDSLYNIFVIAKIIKLCPQNRSEVFEIGRLVAFENFPAVGTVAASIVFSSSDFFRSLTVVRHRDVVGVLSEHGEEDSSDLSSNSDIKFLRVFGFFELDL